MESLLQRELRKARTHEEKPEEVLLQVRAWLEEQQTRRAAIANRLSGNSDTFSNAFDPDLLEASRLFHIDRIKKVCVAYRLRFLENARFKNHIPEEAISAIRRLEDAHQITLSGFHIMAPTAAFKLDNYDDPLLFAPVGNGYFYLVHQWGNEINPWRRLLVWPLRNLGTFTLLCLLLSLMLTLLIPVNKLGLHLPMARVIVFLFAFKSVFAVLLYGFFMGGRQFNSGMWNSRFYNQ